MALVAALVSEVEAFPAEVAAAAWLAALFVSEVAAFEAETVSYTHLTLPTILLV